MKTVTFLDSGIGNKASLLRFVEDLGFAVELTNSPQKIERAEKMIFFGVGSFDACMKRIREVKHLEESLINKISEEKIHILGICLGMQILFERSTEGNESGLSVLTGLVSKMRYNLGHPIPHIGWNTVTKLHESPLLDKITSDMEFFFSHSYAKIEIDDTSLGSTTYNSEFTSLVHSKNIFGCQFHPEKSYSSGQIFMKNFLGM